MLAHCLGHIQSGNENLFSLPDIGEAVIDEETTEQSGERRHDRHRILERTHDKMEDLREYRGRIGLGDQWKYLLQHPSEVIVIDFLLLISPCLPCLGN